MYKKLHAQKLYYFCLLKLAMKISKCKLEMISVRFGRNLDHDIATFPQRISTPGTRRHVFKAGSFHKLVQKSCRVIGVKVLTLFHPRVSCIWCVKFVQPTERSWKDLQIEEIKSCPPPPPSYMRLDLPPLKLLKSYL